MINANTLCALALTMELILLHNQNYILMYSEINWEILKFPNLEHYPCYPAGGTILKYGTAFEYGPASLRQAQPL